MMNDTIFNAGNLIHYHKPSVRTSIYCIYPYDREYNLEHVHLLEHILIHGFIYDSAGTGKYKGSIDYLNGNTLDIAISFSSTVHYTGAWHAALMMMDFINHPFVINEEILGFENKIIAVEEDVIQEKFAVIDGIKRYFDNNHKEKEEAQITQIQRLYKGLIEGTKPIILMQGDFSRPEVQAAYTYMKHSLKVTKQTKFQQPNLSAFVSNPPSYIPQIQSITKGENKMIYMYIFFPLKKEEPRGKATNLSRLMSQFITSCLYEYLREIEGIAYEVKRIPKITPHGLQSSWSFVSQSSSQELLLMIDNFFLKKEEDFQHIVKKVAQEFLQTEDDHYMTFYNILRNIYFNGKIESIPDIASSLELYSYEEFRNFYEENIQYIAIQLA